MAKDRLPLHTVGDVLKMKAEKGKPTKPKPKKWMGPPPETCDLCQASIVNFFIDGKTYVGPWANMCPTCHSASGMGLGTGKGQKYQKIGNDFVKVEG